MNKSAAACSPPPCRLTPPRHAIPSCRGVAADVRDLVAVYKNPPYPIFYDVVHHSFALVGLSFAPVDLVLGAKQGAGDHRGVVEFMLRGSIGRAARDAAMQAGERHGAPPARCRRRRRWDAWRVEFARANCRESLLTSPLQVPMLASGLYYKSKFSSTVLTSLITGASGRGAAAGAVCAAAARFAIANSSCDPPSYHFIGPHTSALQSRLYHIPLPLPQLSVYQDIPPQPPAAHLSPLQ
jgi:hypothetical protein